MEMMVIEICVFAAICCLSSVDCFHEVLTFSTGVANKGIDKLAVDSTGVLIVGAKNTLYRLSSDLELQESFSTGPNNESVSRKCKPFERDCIFARNDSFHLVDNHVSIIQLYNGQDFFLVCETQHNGLCYIQSDKNNLADRKYLLTDESYLYYNLLGSHNYMAMIADYKSENKTTFFDTNLHYVALSYDGKPKQFHTHEFSTLKLRYFGQAFTFREYETGRSFMEVRESYKNDFILKIVYGFETSDHVYFVFIRSSNVNVVETKLARICKSDRYYYSYIEIPVTCKEPNAALYRLASSGYYHSANETLFLAFGSRTHVSGMELDPNEGSFVCSYTQSAMDQTFFHVQFECYGSGVGIRPSWSSREHGQKCKIYDISLNNKFCGQKANAGIESTSSYSRLEEHLIFKLGSKRIVSALYVIVGVQPTLIMGTSDGYMIKAKLLTGEKYAEYDVSGDRSVPVSRDIVADPSKQYLYLTTGNKITKMPLYSCIIHAECGTCITNNDYHDCGWCGNRCSLLEECRSTNYTWHNQSCPPFISQVSPLLGPVNGRTLLTIHGERFGNASVSVSTGQVKCDVQEYNDTRILCSTRDVANATTLPVQVNIEDSSQSLHKFNISGMSEIYTFDFKYLVPAVTQIHPTEGAMLGKNLLTITGRNLEIGSNLKIYVSDSDIDCKVMRKEYDKIICQLATYVETIGGSSNQSQEKPEQCVGYGNVEIHIDGAVITTEDAYCYKPDPVVNKVTPLKTIQSGGNTISIHGLNLDTFKDHALVLQPLNVTVNCQLVDESLVTCKYPSFSQKKILGDGHMDILMGGFSDFGQDSWNFQVFPDPVFQRLTSQTSLTPIKEDEKLMLQLLGKGLDDGLVTEDYSVTVDGVDCAIVELRNTYLKCDLGEVLNSAKVVEVEVQAGNYREIIGSLRLNMLDNSDILHRNYVILGGVLGGFLFFCIVLCIVFKRKHLPPFKKHLRRFQEADILQDTMTFQNLMSRVENDEPSSAVPNNYTPIGAEEGATGGTQDVGVDSDTLNLLEKQNLLVDREYLELGESIGHGQFGCVYKGFLRSPKEKVERLVAVKTILKTSSSSDINIHEFLNEAMIMKDFNHPNVLSLIGVCLDKGEFPLVILPFMENGDLLTYIRNEKNNPKVRDLVSVGLHIGKGMDYLSGIKFVHRDLAARNCMLDAEMVAKVADFGLSRDIYSDHYYRSDNKKKLPVKWMAPESLQHGKYTAKSDVWSFGVVIWELMTRGASPYNEVDNWDMFSYLKEGRRLPRPTYCPIELYDIMMKCWNFNPSKRPTFKWLVDEVSSILTASERGSKIGDVMLDLDSTTSTG